MQKRFMDRLMGKVFPVTRNKINSILGTGVCRSAWEGPLSLPSPILPGHRCRNQGQIGKGIHSNILLSYGKLKVSNKFPNYMIHYLTCNDTCMLKICIKGRPRKQ